MNLKPGQSVFVTLTDRDKHQPLHRFYQQLFGQEPSVMIPGVYSEFELPGLKLGIFWPKPEYQAEFAEPSSGGMSLCLEVENLEDAIAHLTQLDCPPPGVIQQTSHGREIYAYDPCGNRLILHESCADVLG